MMGTRLSLKRRQKRVGAGKNVATDLGIGLVHSASLPIAIAIDFVALFIVIGVVEGALKLMIFGAPLFATLVVVLPLAAFECDNGSERGHFFGRNPTYGLESLDGGLDQEIRRTGRGFEQNAARILISMLQEIGDVAMIGCKMFLIVVSPLRPTRTGSLRGPGPTTAE